MSPSTTSCLPRGNHALPFGGVGKSGFGRYKGEFGFYAFTNIKAVLVDKDSKKMEANWFPYTEKKYRIFSDLTRALYSPGRISGGCSREPFTVFAWKPIRPGWPKKGRTRGNHGAEGRVCP